MKWGLGFNEGEGEMRVRVNGGLGSKGDRRNVSVQVKYGLVQV